MLCVLDGGYFLEELEEVFVTPLCCVPVHESGTDGKGRGGEGQARWCLPFRIF